MGWGASGATKGHLVPNDAQKYPCLRSSGAETTGEEGRGPSPSPRGCSGLGAGIQQEVCSGLGSPAAPQPCAQPGCGLTLVIILFFSAVPGPLVLMPEQASAPYLWKARLAAGLCRSTRRLLKLYLVGDICGRRVEDFLGLVWKRSFFLRR